MRYHPRVYRLHDSLPAAWSRPWRDAAGHWWVDLGRFVLTTSPK